jgi:hypothetical protein
MSDEAVSYPDDASAATFLLTIRGTMAAGSLEEGRTVHNATAGAPPSVAAARSLGDLSHNVYVGYGQEQRGEMLFIDHWNSLSGLGRFFSDPQVEAGGNTLFTSRESPLWAPAGDFGSYHLPTPSGRAPAGIGLLQAQVTSLDKAASAFRAYASATINRARRQGLVSHSLWTRVPDPGTPAEPEIIGVDVWLDADEMSDYYDLMIGFEHLGPAFAGKPDSSIWRTPPGEWIEW